MFIANTITIWTEALKTLFDDNYSVPELQNIMVATDYPQEEVQFPSIWVNFVPSGTVSNVGIGYSEKAAVDGGYTEVFRWSFSGIIELVVSAMGNLERALIADEISKAIAIGRVGENDEGSLRDYVQTNDYVGMIASWEAFTIGGGSETQGTPWGTDDIIYEISISLPVEGEVVLDPSTGLLVPLSAITVTPLGPGEGDPPVITGGQAVGDWV